ncbi:MAG: hypothetical protein AB1589_34365 [Cyanobacteriota bacterium]
MERSITLPLFFEFSVSLLGFLLLVSLFFYQGNTGTHTVLVDSGSTVAVEMA